MRGLQKVQATVFLGLVVSGMASCQKPAGGSAARQFPLAVISKQCIDFSSVKRGKDAGDLRECAVSEFAQFGALDGQTYYYALYCLIPNYANKAHCGDGSFIGGFFAMRRGLAIFTGKTGDPQAHLLFERVNEAVGTLVYSKPEILASSAGTLLNIPIEEDGIGHFNHSEYYLRSGDGWKQLESTRWLEELKQRIPDEFEIRRGVRPDMAAMQADVDLFNEGDRICCPMGGVAHVGLGVRDGRIVIQSMSVDRN